MNSVEVCTEHPGSPSCCQGMVGNEVRQETTDSWDSIELTMAVDTAITLKKCNGFPLEWRKSRG